MRFVILGAGSIGQRHLKNVLSRGHEVPLVYDPNPAKAQQINKLSQRTVFTTNESEAISHPCDAVFICSPSVEHLRQLKIALDQQMNVFVEKPLGHTIKQTKSLADQAKQTGSVVLVACNMRFFSSLRLVKQLLDSGEVGTPLSAHASFGFYLPYWRPGTNYLEGYGAQAKQGGGVILDCVHELDFLRWMFGEPEEVFCMASKVSRLKIDTEDLASAIVRFESGLIAELHFDYLQPTYRRSLEIIGEARTLVWDYIDQTVRLYTPKNNTHQVFQENINYQLNDMYLSELEHFEKCLLRETEPEQDLYGGRATLMVAEAMKRSAREHKMVRLSEMQE